jgi:mannose-6-phosphate isomerase-like protein (cupin superfamily)
MRNALLLSLIVAGAAGAAAQNTPAPAAGTGKAPASTPTAKPASPQAGRGAQAAARSGVQLTVTDPQGASLGDIDVTIIGPTNRSGTTNGSGRLQVTGLQAGTYRLVFSAESVTTLEKEVELRANQNRELDVTLNPAPPPREIVKIVEKPAPPPEVPPAAVVGPKGESRVQSLVDLAEQEYERKQPRRESLVACSGNTRSTLLQLNQDQPQRLYDNAESLFYVIAGEGFLRVGDRETRLEAGSFASVPRSTAFTLGRRGRNPLILLTILSGEPCEEAR